MGLRTFYVLQLSIELLMVAVFVAALGPETLSIQVWAVGKIDASDIRGQLSGSQILILAGFLFGAMITTFMISALKREATRAPH